MNQAPCRHERHECLAHIHRSASIDLIMQQWFSGSVWRSTIGWGKWLHDDGGRSMGRRLRNQTYFGWYRLSIKVLGVFGIAVFGIVVFGAFGRRRRHGMTMNVSLVNHERKGLPRNRVKRIRNQNVWLALVISAPPSGFHTMCSGDQLSKGLRLPVARPQGTIIDSLKLVK